MKPIRTWILIANSAHGRVVQNDGPGHGLSEVKGLDFNRDHAPVSASVADKQGRSFDSHGTGRHAMEPATSPERIDERKFVADIAEVLENKRQEDAYDRLILIASPRTLGDIRAALSDHVAKLVYSEIAKDLTHISVHDLPDHINEFLAV